MKLRIYEDELWPFYDIEDVGYDHVEVDLDPQTVQRIERVHKEFKQVQDILRWAYHNG